MFTGVEQARKECEDIAALGLKSKIAVHVRCDEKDVRAAIDSGVDAINVYMATSAQLSKYSHGKSIEKVIETATRVLAVAISNNVEVRFSCEDSFRSNLDDIIDVYRAITAIGVHRVGLADTVGVATPAQVAAVTKRVREVVGENVGINFHTHNDTGCCIANALVALESGATHIDTTILGIGERNGMSKHKKTLASLTFCTICWILLFLLRMTCRACFSFNGID